MKFVIAGKEYDLIESKFTFAEARALERVTGLSTDEILTDTKHRGKIDVLQAMLWISMKRIEPTLTFSDLDDIEIDDIEWPDQDDDEAVEVPPTGVEAEVSTVNA